MSTHNIPTDINIIDHGADVRVVLHVGFAQHALASLHLRHAGGAQAIDESMSPETPYGLGSAAALVAGRIMFCSGQLSDPGGGGTGQHFFAVCNFFQGGIHVGSSNPLAGTYDDGQALVNFNFICRFK